MKIKGFDKNLMCRGFQFEVGKEYRIESEKLELCSDSVFHYCDSLQKVHEYYSCLSENRFCEIEVLGEEITDGEKCGSNHIKILREILGNELNALKGFENGNTGLFNTGYRNTGNRNTGDRNTGYWNTGYRNTGNRNTGDRNTGNCNTGDCNTGYRNTGDCNTGNWNTGYRNTGYWNTCDNSNGVFCNEEDKNIRIFNIASGMSLSEFRDSKYYAALCSSPFNLTAWIEYTDDEKRNDEQKSLIGGYLKSFSHEEACAEWWKNMTEENKEIVKSIPNFDPLVFKDITGIEV